MPKLDGKSIERKVGLAHGNETHVASVRARFDGDLDDSQYKFTSNFSDENLQAEA